MTPTGLAARRMCAVVAHDHMRQDAQGAIHAFFDGLYNLRPFYKPEVHTMALRDGSMWSSTPTDSEDRGASRRADVRREASPLESSTPTGGCAATEGCGFRCGGGQKNGTPAACRGLCVPCGFVCLRIGYHKSGKQSMESFSGSCQRFLYCRRYWAGVKPVVSRKL